ncbi:MAG: hydantoinase/carbamoylase family amidase [Eubacterium sp.]|nr:hydantoinase/carbamoylase family amidase [Eubacterium sp.]
MGNIQKELDWIERAIDDFAETSIRGGEYWRASYTEEDRKGIEMLTSWMEEAGMEVYMDDICNLFGRIEGESDAIIMTGSNRDTVKHAGKYGGALGILCSLEAVRALYEEFGKPKKSVEVVATVEEEASRFNRGYNLGSRGIVGELVEEDLRSTDMNGITLREAIADMSDSADIEGVPEGRTDIEHFVELSAEMGGVMEKSLKKVGLVQSIAGNMIGEIVITGEQNHAGTTPMSMRRDPVPVAAKLIDEITSWAEDRNDRVVCTFGNIEVYPGKQNIIAEKVRMTFDIRSTNASLLSEARSIMKDHENAMGDINVEVTVTGTDDPADMDLDGVLVMRDIAAAHDMKYMRIDSGAGHDAQVFADVTKSNMIFVPSEKGIAHSPLEYTSREDLEQGYVLLKEYLKKLAW